MVQCSSFINAMLSAGLQGGSASAAEGAFKSART